MQKSFFAVAAVAALTAGASASTDLALWTFESSVPLTAGPHVAEGGVFAAISQATGTTGGTYSNPVGNGSLESFSSNGWNTGEYYQFTTSTVGYQSISITWDQTRSSTGPATFDLLVSVNGGAFTTLLNDYTVLFTTPWSSINPRDPSFTFGPISGGASLNDAALVTFRLVSQVDAASTGTNRVDNIQITGTLIPTPGALALAGLAGIFGILRRRN